VLNWSPIAPSWLPTPTEINFTKGNLFMATSPTSTSALLSGAAKDDVVGLNGDYNFTISDLLANDPGAAAKLNISTQFFFGDVAPGNFFPFPSMLEQVAYLAQHHITAHLNETGTAFTSFDINAGATDFRYFEQIGNKGTWSTATVDVAGAPVPPPVPHDGVSLFSENFGAHYLNAEDYLPDGLPEADSINLNPQIGIDPVTQLPIHDPNGWFGLGVKSGEFYPTVQLVADDTGVSSAPGTTDDYWLNFLPTGFDRNAIKKTATGDLTHTFTDGTAGADHVSFDLANFDFNRTDSTGQVVHFTTKPTDTFDFKIDGNVVFHTTAQQIHDTVGDNTMQHVNLLVSLSAGEHTLALVYHHEPEGVQPVPPPGAPIEHTIGIGIDSIHINDWII
jgi:hypothetical protein